MSTYVAFLIPIIGGLTFLAFMLFYWVYGDSDDE